MARYTAAVCRLCRREGQKLFLKGDRCYTGKCAGQKNLCPRSARPGKKENVRIRLTAQRKAEG